MVVVEVDDVVVVEVIESSSGVTGRNPSSFLADPSSLLHLNSISIKEN